MACKYKRISIPLASFKKDPAWQDHVGDILEGQGVDPSRIFEFHGFIPNFSDAGGIVVSNANGKNKKPKNHWRVARLIVVRKSMIIEVSPGELVYCTSPFINSVTGRRCIFKTDRIKSHIISLM